MSSTPCPTFTLTFAIDKDSPELAEGDLRRIKRSLKPLRKNKTERIISPFHRLRRLLPRLSLSEQRVNEILVLRQRLVYQGFEVPQPRQKDAGHALTAERTVYQNRVSLDEGICKFDFPPLLKSRGRYAGELGGDYVLGVIPRTVWSDARQSCYKRYGERRVNPLRFSGDSFYRQTSLVPRLSSSAFRYETSERRYSGGFDGSVKSNGSFTHSADRVEPLK